MLKIITIFNWVFISVLALLVALETFFPAKGGDAAGQGMGKAIYYLAIIILLVLLVLNLLPYNWSKYLACALIIVPLIALRSTPILKNFGRKISNALHAKPYFDDPERDRIAKAVFDGNLEKVKKLLRTPPPRLREPDYGNALLEVAVRSAVKFSDRKAERCECLRLLLEAGASITSTDSELDAAHIYPASSGDAEVLKVLLDHGADPNARGHDYATGRANGVPIIFEAISTWYGAKACVSLLLEHGADPNAIAPSDGDTQKPSILIFAADRQRWDICRLLLQKGADAQYRTPDGQSLQSLVQAAEGTFTADGDVTLEDFEQVKKAVQ